MMEQVLAPSMQHAQEADLGAQMGRVSSDGAESLGRGAEQDIVDEALVLEGEGRDLLRHREDNMEILGVEEFRLAVSEPLRTGERLALRAIPIATGIIGDALVPAAVALLDMTAKRCCATQLDCGHSATLRGGESGAVLLSICVAVAAEHIRHFGGVAGHRTRV